MIESVQPLARPRTTSILMSHKLSLIRLTQSPAIAAARAALLGHSSKTYFLNCELVSVFAKRLSPSQTAAAGFVKNLAVPYFGR